MYDLYNSIIIRNEKESIFHEETIFYIPWPPRERLHICIFKSILEEEDQQTLLS